MIEKIKRAINWLNWNIGGLRHPDCFFPDEDPIGRHIETFGVDEPTLN